MANARLWSHFQDYPYLLDPQVTVMAHINGAIKDCSKFSIMETKKYSQLSLPIWSSLHNSACSSRFSASSSAVHSWDQYNVASHPRYRRFAALYITSQPNVLKEIGTASTSPSSVQTTAPLKQNLVLEVRNLCLSLRSLLHFSRWTTLWSAMAERTLPWKASRSAWWNTSASGCWELMALVSNLRTTYKTNMRFQARLRRSKCSLAMPRRPRALQRLLVLIAPNPLWVSSQN